SPLRIRQPKKSAAGILALPFRRGARPLRIRWHYSMLSFAPQPTPRPFPRTRAGGKNRKNPRRRLAFFPGACYTVLGCFSAAYAGVMELADVTDSKSVGLITRV